MGIHDFVLSIERLQLINTPATFRNYRLLDSIQHIFSASAIFTHIIDPEYLFIRARLGISLEESLQYAALSYSVSVYATLKQGCGIDKQKYLSAPVRNTDGEIVAVTTMLRRSEYGWKAAEAAFFQPALRYLEHHIAEHDTANIHA